MLRAEGSIERIFLYRHPIDMHEIDELRKQCERAGASSPAQEILKRRRERSAPLFAAFRQWVDELLVAHQHRFNAAMGPPTSSRSILLASRMTG